MHNRITEINKWAPARSARAHEMMMKMMKMMMMMMMKIPRKAISVCGG